MCHATFCFVCFVLLLDGKAGFRVITPIAEIKEIPDHKIFIIPIAES